MVIKGTLKSVKKTGKIVFGKELTLPKKLVIEIETESLSHSQKSMLFVRGFEQSEVTIEVE